MMTIDLQVRPAVFSDQRGIADLIYSKTHFHRHLDWYTPLEWLGSPFYWVIEDNSRIIAALACPQDPPGIAWVRLFTHVGHITAQESWSTLWETVRVELGRQCGITVAVITQQEWYQAILRESGFESRQQVVMLEWNNYTLPQCTPVPGATIRPMMLDDLPQVAEVDREAFAPLWQNSLPALKKAHPQAVIATVAEGEDGLSGYLLCTQNAFWAHLARLAVRPKAQHQGIGLALVNDLISRLNHAGIQHLTVNTQRNNYASLALYRKTGFVLTGKDYPVYEYEVATNN